VAVLRRDAHLRLPSARAGARRGAHAGRQGRLHGARARAARRPPAAGAVQAAPPAAARPACLAGVAAQLRLPCVLLGGAGGLAAQKSVPGCTTRWPIVPPRKAARRPSHLRPPKPSPQTRARARARARAPAAAIHRQVREPTAAVFSAESMLRGMGAPLGWTMARQQGAARGGGGGGGGGGGVAAAAAASRGAAYVDVEAGPAWSAAGGLLKARGGAGRGGRGGPGRGGSGPSHAAGVGAHACARA
jgi:hypothetical protein